MISNVYTIQDVLAGVFMPPFLAINDEVCKRSIIAQMRTQQPDFVEDKVLYHIGTFDDIDGSLTPSHPHAIVNLLSLYRLSLMEQKNEVFSQFRHDDSPPSTCPDATDADTAAAVSSAAPSPV